METISFYVAFIAGLLSFLSPCILPVIPGYVSFISGVSLKDLEQNVNHQKVIFNSLLFISGFSIVFIVLGATATFLGQFFLDKFDILLKVAGIIIILFGFHLLGVFNLSFLNFERRLTLLKKPFGIFGSFLIGASFAFAWVPCVGPILAGILALAAAQNTVIKGTILLSFYSIGLAIPFFLTAIFLQTFFTIFSQIKKYFRLIEIISGIILLVIGSLIFSNNFQLLIKMF
jgi:cytochrome c-type biogenesis protein